MKTCMILEINNGKAVVIFPDGKMDEIKARSDWKVGQTVSAGNTNKASRSVLAVAACFVLVFAAITPFAVNYYLSNPMLERDVNENLLALGDPAIVATTLETADKDYSNVFDLIDSTYNDIEVDYGEDYDGESNQIAPLKNESVVEAKSSGAELADSFELFSGSGAGTAEEGNSGSVEKDSSADTFTDIKDTDFSETNIQVEGIQEADIIKTDGQYIYAINSKNLIVLEANNGDPKILTKLEQDNKTGYYTEMYIEKSRLIAIKESTPDTSKNDISFNTHVDIFDITDPAKPGKLNTFSQSGYYSDSRMANGYLYLISDYMTYQSAIDKEKRKTFLPEYCYGDKSQVAEPKDIKISPDCNYPSYTVLGSINVKEAKDFTDKKNFLSSSGEVYVSGNNIFLTGADNYINTEEKGVSIESDATQIIKLSYKNGEFSDIKTATIPGYVQGQFFMDEYKDTFRVVTHANWYGESKSKPQGIIAEYDGEGLYYSYGSYTALFTLDNDLNELGKIIDIAPGEDLYSCRFMEDYAYFVTFRQVDPLFTADLRDPENPKLVGELKIPGFSEYMHPYDDGLLLGLGSDADENTGRVGNLKLTMFDNNNPKNIKEKHTLIINGFDYTEAADNHKAILVDSDKKLIAFPSGGVYLVFTYDKKNGFKQIAKMTYEDDNDYEYWENVIRGLYINDTFYIITPNIIKTFDMQNDFAAIKRLRINEGAEPVGSYGYIMENMIID